MTIPVEAETRRRPKAKLKQRFEQQCARDTERGYSFGIVFHAGALAHRRQADATTRFTIHGVLGARYTSFVGIMKKPATVAGAVINAGKMNLKAGDISPVPGPLYIYPVITAADSPITHLMGLFLKGRRARTVETTRFSNVLVCPVEKRSVMDVSVLELKNPLTSRSPFGASFLRIFTRVITPGDNA